MLGVFPTYINVRLVDKRDLDRYPHALDAVIRKAMREAEESGYDLHGRPVGHVQRDGHGGPDHLALVVVYGPASWLPGFAPDDEIEPESDWMPRPQGAHA